MAITSGNKDAREPLWLTTNIANFSAYACLGIGKGATIAGAVGLSSIATFSSYFLLPIRGLLYYALYSHLTKSIEKKNAIATLYKEVTGKTTTTPPLLVCICFAPLISILTTTQHYLETSNKSTHLQLHDTLHKVRSAAIAQVNGWSNALFNATTLLLSSAFDFLTKGIVNATPYLHYTGIIAKEVGMQALFVLGCLSGAAFILRGAALLWEGGTRQDLYRELRKKMGKIFEESDHLKDDLKKLFSTYQLNPKDPKSDQFLLEAEDLDLEALDRAVHKEIIAAEIRSTIGWIMIAVGPLVLILAAGTGSTGIGASTLGPIGIATSALFILLEGIYLLNDSTESFAKYQESLYVKPSWLESDSLTATTEKEMMKRSYHFHYTLQVALELFIKAISFPGTLIAYASHYTYSALENVSKKEIRYRTLSTLGDCLFFEEKDPKRTRISIASIPSNYEGLV